MEEYQDGVYVRKGERDRGTLRMEHQLATAAPEEENSVPTGLSFEAGTGEAEGSAWVTHGGENVDTE